MFINSKKLSLIFSCLLIILLSSAIVSANDSDDSVNTLQSTTDNLNSISSNNVNYDTNKNSVSDKKLTDNKNISKNNEKLETNVKEAGENGSFSQLQKIIDETENSGTIFLTNDYKADQSQKTINIKKSITIYGNGHTLDANYLDKIFTISLKSSDVVKLYDLTLTNGYNCADINIYGGNLYMSDCLIKDRTDDRKVSRKSSSIYSTKSNLYLTNNTIIFTGSGINLYDGRCLVDSCNFIGDNRNYGTISTFDRTINVKEGTFVKVTNSIFYNTVTTTKFDIFSEKTEVNANDNWWGSNKNVKPNTIKGKVYADTWYYLDINQDVIEIGDTTSISLYLKTNNGIKAPLSLDYSISNVHATNATVFQRGNKIYYTPTRGNSGDLSLTFTYYNFSTYMTFHITHIEKNIIVNNYDELATALENIQKAYYEEYTITLAPGNYNATRSITLTSSNALRNLVINGNNNIIDGRNKYKFIDVQGNRKSINGLSLTIANTTFQTLKQLRIEVQ